MFIKKSWAKDAKGNKCCTYEIVKSYREKNSKTPKHKVISNITHLPEEIRNQIGILLKSPKAKVIENINNFFEKSYNYGDALFLYEIMKKVGIMEAFRELPEKIRKIIIAVIISRILSPRSKLGTSSFVKTNGLYKLFEEDIEKINEDKIYRAMDVFYTKYEKIFDKIYKNNSKGNKLLLYDITSIYFEGIGPEELAKLGYSRDGRADAVQIILLLCLNENGFPIYFDIREGNTQDKQTVISVIEEIKKRITLEETIFIGDRGMISIPNIKYLEQEEIDYILGITHTEAREIIYSEAIDVDLFDKELPAVVYEEDFEIEKDNKKIPKKKKYILCGSKYRRENDLKVLNNLLERGKKELEKIKEAIEKGRLKNHEVIIRKAQKKLTQTKCDRFYDFQENNGKFIIIEKPFIEKAKKMCGYYMLKTTSSKLTAAEVEENYKRLQTVENAFRDLKNLLEIRPIYHYKEKRVKTHIMLCIFAQTIVRFIKKILIEKKWITADKKNSFRSFIDKFSEIKIGVFNINNIKNEIVSNLTAEHKVLLSLFDINPKYFTTPFFLD